MISTSMLRTAERFFSRVSERIRTTILSAELAGAEFVPFIQPVFKGDRLAGGEVLLRVLKSGVYRSPERYLPAMESCDAINDVTCSLLAGVEAFFRDYDGDLPEDFRLSFNICARQLNVPAVTDAVMRFHRVFEGRIRVVLEIVERGAMVLDDFALETMQQLTDAGVRFAIDDFGSGSSCLKYIEHSGFSAIKLDKCLTVASNGALIYSAVIDSIVMLSERLQIQVVAEGVENHEQLSLLKDKGVHLFQGYLFSRPIPLREFCAHI
ncbi:EAL domain-containing protein [Enterobacter bugandensis]|uniref:EAL domain-containing protein n=1 Tax=Enterobacter bugandensis TaxID=881260 RepID=UPI0029DBBBFF|nr:EAL domain-containing protein [Enterobacter bugandensis]MDX7624391.1 EAL domain-containing protein [Enterobacter bugandensis]